MSSSFRVTFRAFHGKTGSHYLLPATSCSRCTSSCLINSRASDIQDSTVRGLHTSCINDQKKPPNRTKSSLADATYISEELDTSSRDVRPFTDIPIPGGYDGGLMGILAPLYHAWKGQAFKKPHIYQQKCAKELGPIYRQNSIMGPIVALSDPHDFETLFRKVGKHPHRPIVQSWIDWRRDNNLNLGLITSEGDEWATLRSAVAKGILKPTALVPHVDSMHEVVLDLIQKLKSIRRPDGVIPDIETELYKWAMESSTTFFFDRRLNLINEKQLKKENQEFFDALQVLTWETAKLFMLPPSILKRLPDSRNPMLLSNQAWSVIFKQVKVYIDDRMGALAKKAARGEDFDDGTFLSYLVLEDKLSPEEIIGSVSEIMPASVDTTAHTSTWVVHLVSKSPQVQEKLYDEVQQFIPEGTTPTAEKLDKMRYLRAVVKEAQRLYPITIATARILEEDIEIRGYNIPAQTHCQTTFYNACRDPNVFDNPEEFRPERWFDKSKKYHPFANLPFGHGTRMCVGRRLAQQEMYLLLTELVRNFKLTPTKPNVGSNCGITIHPEESIEPKLIDRSQH